MTSSGEQQDFEEQDLGEIRALDFQRYAIAAGDHNPLYFDDDAARRAGYDGIVAPLNYLSSIMNWGAGPQREELLADGTRASYMPSFFSGLSIMGGGHRLTLVRPVRPGQHVLARRRLVETFQKENRAGRLHFAIYETRYLDRLDGLLLTCIETIIAVAEN